MTLHCRHLVKEVAEVIDAIKLTLIRGESSVKKFVYENSAFVALNLF